jgi:outer membrane protein insertion porin family
MRFFPAAMALVLAQAAVAQRLAEIKVSGNARLPTAALIAASGLRTGQAVTRAELDGAVQKLFQTGFFASVNYRFDPMPDGSGPGYALTLQVSEEAAHKPVELDFPDVDAERLWQQLKSADPFIDRQMPDNDRASEYYKRAIEAALRNSNHAEEIVMRPEADMSTGRSAVAFRPAHLPRIAAMRFEGNAAITSAALEAAMAKVAMGQEYTARDFRRMLELNVRPLYEDLGRLTVAFPSVKMVSAGDAAVAVTAAIDEGPAWRLGKVVLTGDALPLAEMLDAARFAYGVPANWRQFTAGLVKMEQVLRRDGYITVSSKPMRAFQQATQVVDVNVEVRKGPQFLFGELFIEGLDELTQHRVATLWALPAGAPMNQLYIDDFVRSAWPILKGKYRTFGSELHIRPGTNVADVTLKFH